MTNLLPLDMPAYLGVNIQPCSWEVLGLFLTVLKNKFPGSEFLIIADFRVQNSLVVLHHLPTDTTAKRSQFLGALTLLLNIQRWFYPFCGRKYNSKGTTHLLHVAMGLKEGKEWKNWLCLETYPQSFLSALNKNISPWPAWNYVRMGQLKCLNGSMLTTGEQATANNSRACDLGNVWIFIFK